MLLGHLEPLGNSRTLSNAADAIIATARTNQLIRTPWSLAELRPDEADHLWLLQWAANLEWDTVSSWIGSLRPYCPNDWGVTRQAAFGLVFLLFAAEVARRDATAGHL